MQLPNSDAQSLPFWQYYYGTDITLISCATWVHSFSTALLSVCKDFPSILACCSSFSVWMRDCCSRSCVSCRQPQHIPSIMSYCLPRTWAAGIAARHGCCSQVVQTHMCLFKIFHGMLPLLPKRQMVLRGQAPSDMPDTPVVACHFT